ncbi:MAG TPA: hypothetical protein VK705_08400 [Ferruginibacter sp.]|jgi:hypothetical protein|nr:hypothetical protein [Ferruginibacter sp.]
MFQLNNKTILIISQQDWGGMFISKHHYAIELSKLGNKVYFINSPDQKNKLKLGQIVIEETKYEGLFTVSHRFFFPYFIRFKSAFFFDKLVTIHLNNIIKKIDQPIDMVWSFDIANAIPLKNFPASYKKIFMPVDEPTNQKAIRAAESADIILSVTNEIIEKYADYNVPKYFINHGVAEIFINKNINTQTNDPIRVGLSGNFLRPDIDREILLQIIRSNTGVIFECWGSISYKNSNLSPDEDVDTVNFIKELTGLPNVIAYGVLAPLILSERLKEVDLFLICYDIKRDQSNGTNYHKILEYLGTGKVIVSNNVTTYKAYPGLLEMGQSRDNNDELPALFNKVIKDINAYNVAKEQTKRIDFAKQFLYQNQLEKIESFLN